MPIPKHIDETKCEIDSCTLPNLDPVYWALAMPQIEGLVNLGFLRKAN